MLSDFKEHQPLHGNTSFALFDHSEGIQTGVTWVVGRAQQTNRAKSSPSN